ncbi:hypothetical protein AB833_27930 [Chromatiales bacterium (ex Bugula neritina AB1)]|nr:hypothetical protein AB833_27930 [Chromatiales bacterium (ex Bugula neritina AB1)]
MAREAINRQPGLSTELEEMVLASTAVSTHIRQCVFSVPGIRCGSCMRSIEQSLHSMEGVSQARVNLTNRRVTVQWNDGAVVPAVAERLASLGYPSQLIESAAEGDDKQLSYLIRALAVAAFASGNIMLLSVSVWSGADLATNHLFHWISAIIALPAVAYSGQVFFSSAWRAIRHAATNMDVPISIGILLALGLSCYDTLWNTEGAAVYFEAPVMLVFFLLIGRTLDYLMRDKVRKAVDGIARLEPSGAWIEQQGGRTVFRALADIEAGDCLLIAAGDIVAVDCVVVSGVSELDSTMVTGESIPVPVQSGDQLLAGTRNVSAPLRAKVVARAADSHLAKMIALIQSAELTRSTQRDWPDRISRWYAPVVHSAALFSFLGWYFATSNVHQSITVAIAVLIITCPCALGLAVPMVQVVVVRRLFESGILVKDGSSLRRLAKVDTVIFDKTGTLTTGNVRLVNADSVESSHFQLAASMARFSLHPFSRALLKTYEAREDADLQSGVEAIEYPGLGLLWSDGDCLYRLGRASWAIHAENTVSSSLCGVPHVTSTGDELSRSVLALNGNFLAEFQFEDSLRADADSTIDELKAARLPIECLSGDNAGAVASCIDRLAIDRCSADVLPADKVARLDTLAAAGKRVLMVGDGLNDAPALSAAYVSMAPGTASDAGRNSADLVFTANKLSAVPQALSMARSAERSIKQNLVFALLYNAVALPVAVAGLVTPLIAALAMSASSVIVMFNALLLNYKRLNYGSGRWLCKSLNRSAQGFSRVTEGQQSA